MGMDLDVVDTDGHGWTLTFTILFLPSLFFSGSPADTVVPSRRGAQGYIQTLTIPFLFFFFLFWNFWGLLLCFQGQRFHGQRFPPRALPFSPFPPVKCQP
ncbi:hypothetical protein CC2G_000064 [Coprinopsis cinerea AmutBmut pab1-1]|nr:hypothetical protein CC2G_000064 [Coprinopsis cinerea AmutBmut pab1-1]